MKKNILMSLIASTSLALSAPALSRELPADCSSAEVPGTPVEVSVSGNLFAPKQVTLRRTGGSSNGDESFDRYALEFKSEDAFNAPLEASVTVMVPEGASVEGKKFRKVAVKDMSKQPSASKIHTEPEVQGWALPLSVMQALPSLEVISFTGIGVGNFVDDPLPAEHPLFELDNVILRPHVAYETPEANRMICQIAADSLIAYFEDRPINVVAAP